MHNFVRANELERLCRASILKRKFYNQYVYVSHATSIISKGLSTVFFFFSLDVSAA